jgi:lipopolysaccharide assembly outer membrane protein LptD (OstA)
MKVFKIFALALLMIFIAQGRTFAEKPEISANETYFDVFRGIYVLQGDVDVKVNNHGFKAHVTADAAQVSLINQKCWADGNVKLAQEGITFGCDRAYMQWSIKTVSVKGNVRFKNKKGVTIKSDTAVFNWEDKLVDFYGKVILNGEEYQHVRFNVVESKILDKDKTFDAPEVIIPDADGN